MNEKDLRPLEFIPFYLLWIVSGALTIIDGLLLRQAVTAVAAALGQVVPMTWQVEHHWYVRWVVRAVDPLATAILTIAVFAAIIILDYLYRNAIIKKTIKKTFALVTAIQLGLLIGGVIAITIVANTVGI